jgi:small-conductance mechanosensitive channel
MYTAAMDGLDLFALLGELVGWVTPRLLSLLLALALTLLVAALGVGIARWSRGRIVRTVGRTRIGANLSVLAGNLMFMSVILVTIIIVLGIYGLNLTAVFTVLGVSTVAIGLALQDVLRNIISGIYLLLEHPFKIGDTIIVDGREGEVESIEVRTTVLRMPDGTQALVPNATVLTTTVMNRTAYPTRRVVIRIGGLTDELDDIQRTVTAALAGMADLADFPGPRVHLEAVADGKETVTVDVWHRADRPLPATVLPALQTAFPGSTVGLAGAPAPTPPAAR